MVAVVIILVVHSTDIGSIVFYDNELKIVQDNNYNNALKNYRKSRIIIRRRASTLQSKDFSRSILFYIKKENPKNNKTRTTEPLTNKAVQSDAKVGDQSKKKEQGVRVKIQGIVHSYQDCKECDEKDCVN